MEFRTNVEILKILICKTYPGYEIMYEFPESLFFKHNGTVYFGTHNIHSLIIYSIKGELSFNKVF